jgi:hypothetical protein
MKALLFSIALMGLLVLPSGKAGAQTYEPYPYVPYGNDVPYGSGVPYGAYPYPQQYDPYYDLHTMHYQLYLQQQYPGYPIYQPCCLAVGPVLGPPVVVSRPRVIIAPRLPVFGFRRR